MKTKSYYVNRFNQTLVSSRDIEIFYKSYSDFTRNDIRYEFIFDRVHSLEKNNDEYIYSYLILGFGQQRGYIKLDFGENIEFLFLQKSHWLQKEENIRYIINILFLLGGITIGFLNYFK